MSCESPGSLAALAVPMVLLVLALLQPRRQHRPVGTLLIWRRALARVGSARAATDRLPWSLRLGLTGLLLSVAALAGPLISLRADPPRRLLLVLDRSAEMAALRADGQTRWQAAVARATEVLRGLRDGDEVRLLLVPAAESSAPTGATPSDLADWLAKQSPAAESADWWAELAAHASADGTRPTLAIAARAAAPGGLPPRTVVELIGGRPDDLAVLAARAARLPGGGVRVLATVANVGSVSTEGTLRLLAGTAAEPATLGEPKVIRLPPGQRAAVSWTVPAPEAEPSWRVALSPGDAWVGNDAVSVTMVDWARLRVGLLLAASAAAERDFLDRLLAAADSVELVSDPTQAELLIVAGAAVPRGFAGAAIHLVPPGAAGPAELEVGEPVTARRLERFSPDATAEPSFAAGDLAGLPVARVRPLRPLGSLAQRPVIWTDQGEVAAATWTTADGRRRVALGLSTSRDNLPWTDGWLVFWGRLLAEFRSAGRPTELAVEPRRPLAVEDRSAEFASLESEPSEGDSPWRGRAALLMAAAVLLLAGWWRSAAEA